MNVKSLAVLLFALLFVSLFPLQTLADDDKTAADAVAVQAVVTFLQQLDNGEYEQAWQQTAPVMQAQISKEEWVTRIGGVRPLFGALMSRSVQATRHHTELPGAPDGVYLIISVQSSFAQKQQATETVTAMLGADGIWRVAGYFIK